MKVLQISSAKTFGSRERHFIDLCKGLQSRGHEVFVVVRPSNQWQERLNFLPKENIFSVSIRNSFGIFSAQKIAKIIREKQIEKVHAHVARDYFPTSLACRIAKTAQFFLTRHSLSPMKTFYRFALTNLAKSIALSEKMKSDVERVFPKEKVVFIADGIDLPEISPESRQKMRESFRFENEIPFDSLFIGTIGELKEENGQRDFVLAAQIVAEKFPDSYFTVIGEDTTASKSFRRELKRMVKVFGLEKRFLWLNWVEDLTAFLNSLDVLVSPAQTKKFSWTILEAMANQIAIVTTDIETVEEMLKDNEMGLIVPIKEPVKLADAISRILSDEDLRIKFGEKAKINVKDNFSLQKMIDETEKVYQSIK